jgi:hypothetical protein
MKVWAMCLIFWENVLELSVDWLHALAGVAREILPC